MLAHSGVQQGLDLAAISSVKAFTGFIADAAASAGLPLRLSPHGLRKAACRRLAEAGASANEIMSITGHTDIKEIETYTKAAEQRRLAELGMHKVSLTFDLERNLANQHEGVSQLAR